MASEQRSSTEGQVAARDEQQADRQAQNAEKQRQADQKQRVKEQEQAQKAQLRAGKVSAASKKFVDADPAAQRAKNLNAQPDQGRVDNMTRKDDSQPLQGHFVLIDYSDNSVVKSVEGTVGEGNAGLGQADYGVFLHAGDVDEDGYPLTAVVLLRDEHAAQVVVPYDSLRAAPQGGRR